MDCLAIAFTDHLGGLMIVGAAVAFYVASRAAADALSQSAVTVSPVRHAMAHWASIACVALVAVWLDHAEIAVGVLFSTAVAALSLHLGVTITSTPETRARREGHGFDVVLDLPDAPAPRAAQSSSVPVAAGAAGSAPRLGAIQGSPAWAMVLPVAILALMVGFSGKLTLLHALMFALQGVLVLIVWDTDRSLPRSDPPPGLSAGRRAQFMLAMALALVGAICAVYGAVRMSDETRIMSTGLIASAAIGPLLVLPMIGSASILASVGQAKTAAGASVVIVLLNLCCLLPIVVAGWHVREHYFPATAQAAAPAAAPATTQAVADESADVEPLPEDDTPRVLSFPIAVWRLDTVLLILLGLMLLPVALNLWEMRRIEGVVLIGIYGCYLIVTTVLGRRW